jgi:hypothetical protein
VTATIPFWRVTETKRGSPLRTTPRPIGESVNCVTATGVVGEGLGGVGVVAAVAETGASVVRTAIAAAAAAMTARERRVRRTARSGEGVTIMLWLAPVRCPDRTIDTDSTVRVSEPFECRRRAVCRD